MSIPTNLLKWAGEWSAAATYSVYDVVLDTTVSNQFVYVGKPGSNSATPPNTEPLLWIPYPVTPTPPEAYGSFSSTLNQPLAVGDPTRLLYDTNDIPPVNIALDAPLPTALVNIQVTGTYKVIASVQFDRTMGGNSDIDLYPVINLTPVPNSATRISINQNREDIMTVEWFLPMAAGDQLEINCFTNDNGNLAAAFPSVPPVPAIPSIILTVLLIA